MLTSPTVTATTAKTFRGPAGEEHFIAIEADAGLDFEGQLASIEARYTEARRTLGLTSDTAVFRRLFVSDVLNQTKAAKLSALTCDPAYSPAAVSIVQQPPLPAAKAALLAYHATGAPTTKRRLSGRHLLVERNGARHLWSTGLCAGAEGPAASAEDQTRAVFGALDYVIAGQGARLADNCVRTWIFVKGVDVFYGDMVRGRRDLFQQAGLTEDTHYIASTGIEGACGHAFDLVAMDAYSNLDLVPGQMSYLNDFDRMCATKDYAVTFERGTRIAYADRAHLFVSGTASIDRRGQVLHPGDVLAQLDRALENVEAILHPANAGLSDLMHLIVYLRDPADFAPVQRRLAAVLPETPTVIVQAPVCRPEWLIEVEGVAIAPNDEPSLPRF